ncbi:hypothetical protein [Curtobacterium sp. RRHDQ10]|uniref:hypothetical protein n=1 Tax=Curtobacterium phyllosphaerae TaxID=3413379 RepID=UPI003BF15289
MPRRRQPFREHAFRIITPLVGAIVGLLVAFLLPRLFDGDHPQSVWAYLIGGLVFLLFAGGGIFLGLAIGRKVVGDRIEAAVREPDGKWRHGRFEVDPGGVTFERYWWQIRIPSGKKTTFSGVHLGDDTGRRPPLRQIWTINPQVHIVSFDSDQGHFEIAALPSRIDELRDRLPETNVLQ